MRMVSGMKNRLSFAALIFVAALVFANPGVGAIAKAAASGTTSPLSLIHAARMREPLVPMGSTTPEEDAALSKSLQDYETRSQPDDLRSLESFLKGYPNSPWAPAVLTNLGYAYLHYSYFSRAITSFAAAWQKGRQATEPHAKALVDGAVGELARLDASFGRNDDLEALFTDIGSRPITGSATEAVQSAREELEQAKKDPRHLFLCGPLALQGLMMADGSNLDQVSFLQRYKAGPKGTSLAEVAKLADQAKYGERTIFRKPEQSVPVPSIVHWKVGHFATIVGEANGRLHIHDPVFAHQDF
jgi:hypothetical protein